MQDFPTEHFDHHRLAELQRLPGNLLHDLMKIFLECTPSHITKLSEAADGGACEDFWRSAHALKSSSLNVGATQLAEYCLSAEAFGKAAQLQEARKILPTLEAEFATVIGIFRSQLKKSL